MNQPHSTNTITANPPRIHIIGLGVQVPAQLTEAALQALKKSSLVIGSSRQLALIEGLLASQTETHLLPPLSDLKSLLQGRLNQIDKSGEVITLLASGDPLYYGIGRWLGKQFDASQLAFYPAVSSIQAACHAIGWSLQDAEVISLHGRPLFTLRRKLQAQRKLIILTDKHSNPYALAQECINAGYEQSTLWVCERLGYNDEKVRRFSVMELANQLESDSGIEETTDVQSKPVLTFDALHVSILQVEGQGSYLPSFAGIADKHFITDAEQGKGLLTKREVRLVILSWLEPSLHDVIWDIGAGCGGVAIELVYWTQTASVYAIEHHAERLRCLTENQQRFGVVDNLKVIAGRAPEVLQGLPQANKVFIGGSDGELPVLLEHVWQQLPVNGILLASAVTETTKQHLLQFADALDADADMETTQIAVSRGSRLAGQLLYRPNLPVTLFKFTKC